MKTNMINTNSVMRTICAVVMLLGMSVSAWGLTIELPTSTNIFSLSTTSTNDASSEISKTYGGYTYKLKAGSKCYYYNSAALFIGTTGSYITFPAIANKKLTSVTVWNNSGAAEPDVLICPTDNTTATTGGTETTVSKGSSTTWTLTATSVNTAYRMYINSSKSLQVTRIQLVYSNTAAYKVTFNAEGGSCETGSSTEGSANAGVTLPVVTPSASMASMGWGFYGWAEDAVDDPTTTAPTIVGKAGDTYYPSSATTLHAVFVKGEYTKVTSTSELNSTSKYIFAAIYDTKSYVMTSEYANQKLAAKQIDETSSGKYSAAVLHASWCFTLEANSTYWHILDCNSANSNHYLDTYYTEWYGHTKDSGDPYSFTWSTNHWVIQNKYSTGNRYFGYSNSEEAFKTYNTEQELQIYKETTTPTYCSNPSTVRLVASPAAGGSVVFDDNSSAEMDFATTDGYIGDITATPNDGYDFLNWVSSDESAAVVGTNEDPTTGVIAEGSATITANFYQKRSISYILTEGGVAGEVGNPTTVTKTEKDGFVVGFNLQAHYKNMTLVSVTMGGSPLTEGAEADYEWEVDGSTAMLTIHHANIDGDIVISVSATLMEYTKYAFSCAELTLTKSGVDTMFITSTANKSVRSQEVFHLTGSGLTPSTKFTFSFGNSDLNSRFAFKLADGTTDVSTDASGAIDADIYVVYTPTSGDTDDGLNIASNLTVTMGGVKPMTAVLNTKTIIGRHLPANFVIAAKRNNQWYALPSNMLSSTSNPSMVEIAVDDADNPSIAYTATSNMYSLYDQSAGEYIKFAMKGQSDAPLFGSSSGASIGKSGSAIVTSTLGDGYLWKLVQSRAEGLSNAEEAKYTIYSKNNSTNHLRLKENAGNPIWGLYDSGIDELRLIPASTATVVEAYFIEYGATGGIIEVDANGISAKKVKAKFNGNESSLITLNQTLTSVNESATKYNYTVTFDGSVNFATNDAVGKILMLEWYNISDVLVGVTSIEMPKIIASDATMTAISSSKRFWENMEVHVLPGATLTANVNSTYSYNVTIKQLEIYPGAKVNVSTGTLNVTDLMLRNGWSRAGEKSYGAGKMVIAGSANLTHTNAYLDLYIDNDQYYPLAVPFPVTVEDIKYVYSTRPFTIGGPTGEIRLRYYDGAGRAAGNPFNWKFYGAIDCLDVPETLEPSKGYAIAVKRPTGKAFSVIRLPLTFADAWTTGGEHGSAIVDATPLRKDTVHVNAHGDEETKEADKGWNLIGNPYMGVFNGDDEDFSGHLLAVKNKDNPEGDKIRYVTMPNTSFTDYTQVNVTEADMQPYSSFLIQAKEDCDLVFNTSKIKPSLAPAQFRATPTRMSEQEAYIRLSNENGSDQMGLIIGEDYTAEYETNADLAKMHGELNTLKTYMVYGETDMAYVAINEELAKEWIPVSVRIPADGEYTFSLRNISVINELEGIYLNDSYTNAVINLIEQDYTFIAEAGTITERFSINAIAGHRDTPTEIDVLNAGGDIHGDKPVKFIWNNKVFIWLNGAIYDTTGKRVK